jgi:hypothetical protein
MESAQGVSGSSVVEDGTSQLEAVSSLEGGRNSGRAASVESAGSAGLEEPAVPSGDEAEVGSISPRQKMRMVSQFV